ncbi:MAG: Mce protein [Mycobacterium sp.]|nr:Mce protein [Mycobacterium sp.]
MSKRTASADVFAQVRDTETDAGEAEETAAAELTESSVESEPAEPAETDQSAAVVSKRRIGLTAGVCGLLFALLIAALGFLGWRQYEQYQVTAAGQAGLQAAEDYAVVLTTLDAKHIDDNYRKSLDGATGEFKDAYSQGANQLRQVLIDNKASGTGIVVAAAVKSATPDKVEVLLFVDQSITNASNPSPRIDRNRIDMTMEKVGGRWLASKVEIL